MTTRIEMTLEELKNKIENIANIGWIRSSRRGDTGIGHTIEGLLGYSENNLALPDWGDFEIKSTRRDSKTSVTLLSKSPVIVGVADKRELIEKFGYWDDKRKRQALYITIDGVRPNNRGWIMKINQLKNRIEFTCKNHVTAIQDIDELTILMKQKITNLILIIAERKRQGRDEFFRFSEAYLLAQADINRLIDMIMTGAITFDWRMHLKENNRVRDHGPAYRIQENKLPELYKYKERLI